MPQFNPAEERIAIATFPVKPAGLSCEAELFLGPDEVTKVATSDRIGFTSTGAEQSVDLPITMPSTEGTYHVYIDIYAEGIFIAAYQAIEDVVIKTLIPVEVSVFISPSDLKENGYFVITLTFKNNLDYDVWVRPKFAFGKWLDSSFSAQKVLYRYLAPDLGGGTYINGVFWPGFEGGTPYWDWVDLGWFGGLGSGMSYRITDKCYMDYGYLKVPAKSEASTTTGWFIAEKCWRSGPYPKVWPGMEEFYPAFRLDCYVPLPPEYLDICIGTGVYYLVPGEVYDHLGDTGYSIYGGFLNIIRVSSKLAGEVCTEVWPYL